MSEQAAINLEALEVRAQNVGASGVTVYAPDILTLVARVRALESENATLKALRAEAIAAWNDDARAREVLRACEALETALRERNDEARGSVLLDEKFITDDLGWGEVVYGPLADALRALAGEVAK